MSRYRSMSLLSFAAFAACLFGMGFSLVEGEAILWVLWMAIALMTFKSGLELWVYAPQIEDVAHCCDCLGCSIKRTELEEE